MALDRKPPRLEPDLRSQAGLDFMDLDAPDVPAGPVPGNAYGER